MSKPRDTFKYHFEVDGKIVHRGVTNDLERRNAEHQVRWPNGRIVKIGHKTTREQGLAWEKAGGKAGH